MSLSQFSLPSISQVLERDVERDVGPNAKNVAAHEAADAYIAPPSSTSASFLSALSPQPHLMRTIDLQDNDLEDEEPELFSFMVGFPSEQAFVGDDAQTIFEEIVIEVVAAPQEELPRAPARWYDIDLNQWMMVIRKLFPVRFAEILLRKAGQDLARL